MAWSSPPTFTTGQTITAAFLNALRDNLNETAPAKATITGNATHFVGSGVNSISQREVKYDTIDTSETTGSTSYTNVATVGPSVTITTGGFVMVWHSAQMSNSTTGKYCAASWDNAGVAATDSVAIVSVSATAADQFRAGTTTITTATPGSNTYVMKYKVEAGTGTFQRRRLIVMSF